MVWDWRSSDNQHVRLPRCVLLDGFFADQLDNLFSGHALCKTERSCWFVLCER